MGSWNKSPGRQRFDAWRERQRARERIERERAAVEQLRQSTDTCGCGSPDHESGLSVNERRSLYRYEWETAQVA